MCYFIYSNKNNNFCRYSPSLYSLLIRHPLHVKIQKRSGWWRAISCIYWCNRQNYVLNPFCHLSSPFYRSALHFYTFCFSKNIENTLQIPTFLSHPFVCLSLFHHIFSLSQKLAFWFWRVRVLDRETREWGNSLWSTPLWLGERSSWLNTPSSPEISPALLVNAFKSSPLAITGSPTIVMATPSIISSKMDSVSYFFFQFKCKLQKKVVFFIGFLNEIYMSDQAFLIRLMSINVTAGLFDIFLFFDNLLCR